MEKRGNQRKINGSVSLFLSIIVVFCVLGTVVFLVASKISREMSASAIQNLSESLDLIECTIEAVMTREAEFQELMAQEIALAQDPEAYIRAYTKNRTMVKLSIIYAGKTRSEEHTSELQSH